MQSKRDQVQAHAFVMSRLTSGMLLADPDAPESPLGRTTRGVVIGTVIAVVIAAAAVVYGLINPGGNDSWRTANSLIVNKETGGRFLYVGGRLRPVRNYASALLIGGADLKTTDVRTASLRDTPVGAPVGIPGAPDSVPEAGDLDGGPWQVCSAVATVDSNAGTGTAALTTLVAGAPTDGTGMGADRGIVVAGPDRATYLVWRGSRLRLDKTSGAAVSLGYGSVTPRPVSAAFLDALVSGPDLAAPAVPGRGSSGPSLDGRTGRVGQVFQVRVPGSDSQYYLLRSEGLVPLTDTGAALVLGDPATRKEAYGGSAPTAAVIGAAALKEHAAPGSEGRSPASAGLPDSPPHAVDVPEGSSACARVQPGDGGTRVTTVLVPAGSLAPVVQVDSQQVTAACVRVDATVVRPGHGVLVRALGGNGTAVGDTTYLVADNGVKYRVPTAAALQALGYAQGDVEALPSPLLSMLPSGPDLSQQAAVGGTGAVTTPPGCAPGGDHLGVTPGGRLGAAVGGGLGTAAGGSLAAALPER
ncbi:type VII secretion protein EccB [Streptomyces sp. NPDC004096]|uniref:type VII secretion protein EccB n=1 Tax=unclassified Streptomyces TaxID=2593676 RepID=UPI0033AAAFE3